jgi:hypothetical protein
MARSISNRPLLTRPPSSAPDPRQDDDSLCDYPTDVTLRPSGIRFEPKVRVDAPTWEDSGPVLPNAGMEQADIGEGPTEQTEIGPSPVRTVSAAAIPRGVRAWLEVRSGPTVGEAPIHLTMVRTQIGRGRQADVLIEDRRLSRKHATILFTGLEFRIRDEGSGNGTFLNGSRVVEYALRDSDEVIVGGTTFEFHIKT